MQADFNAVIPAVEDQVVFDDGLAGSIQIDRVIAVLVEGICPANATTTLVVDRVAIVDEMIVRDLDLRVTDDPITTVPDRETDNAGAGSDT